MQQISPFIIKHLKTDRGHSSSSHLFCSSLWRRAAATVRALQLRVPWLFGSESPMIASAVENRSESDRVAEPLRVFVRRPTKHTALECVNPYLHQV